MLELAAIVAAIPVAEARVPDDLRDAWAAYVRVYVQPDGRVADPSTADATTSEGQSYGLVRAVWMDDRETFDRLLVWTRDNLQSGDATKLPAWKWGQHPAGEWAVLDPQPAADADQWMAWALILADRQWDAPAYRRQAQALLNRVWEEETAVVGSLRVLLPGPWAQNQNPVQLNPSYWLPFAWREFAAVDAAHDWTGLIGDAYTAWERTAMASGLPPDWVWVDAASGLRVPPPIGQEAKEDFGFEAFRIAWTLAAEVRWWDERRARALLKPFRELEPRWRKDGRIPAVLRPDGQQRVEWEYPGLYGALLPAWAVDDPFAANGLFRREIRPLRAEHGWGEVGDYYAQNWVWLGIALWRGVGTP